MKKIILPAVMASVLVSGCASILSKSEYPVAFSSSPQGASFIVTNRAGHQIHQGTTPQSLTLKSSSGFFKKEMYTVTMSQPGYDDKTFTLMSGVDGWYWGNILLGGLLGMLIIDPATGAMYKLPDTVDLALNPDAALATDNVTEDSSLTIITVDDLDEAQQSQLEKIDVGSY